MALVLRQFYETRFDVFDHFNDGDKRPLSTVALYDAEENSTYSSLYARIGQFARSRIKEQFGLNFIEFMSLPKEYIQEMFRVSENITSKESAFTNNLQKQLDDIKKMDKR